jgi:hypothetical protein
MKGRRHKLQVSTFPFLAVLLCAMGSLILVLLVMDRKAHQAAQRRALQQAADRAAEAAQSTAARQQEIERRKQQARQEWEKKREALHTRLTQEQLELEMQMKNVRTQLSQIAARLRYEQDTSIDLRRKVQNQKSQLDNEKQALTGLRGAASQADTRARESSQAMERLTADLLQMEQVFKDLKAARERARQTYSVIPYHGRNGEKRQPIYVECAAHGVIFHPDRRAMSVTSHTMLLGGKASEDAPDDVHSEVQLRIARQRQRQAATGGATNSTPYLLLLVRPDGIGTYTQLQSVLRDLTLDFGYEFIDADWVLDFPEEDDQPAAQSWMTVSRTPVESTPSTTPRSTPPTPWRPGYSTVASNAGAQPFRTVDGDRSPPPAGGSYTSAPSQGGGYGPGPGNGGGYGGGGSGGGPGGGGSGGGPVGEVRGNGSPSSAPVGVNFLAGTGTGTAGGLGQRPGATGSGPLGSGVGTGMSPPGQAGVLGSGPGGSSAGSGLGPPTALGPTSGPPGTGGNGGPGSPSPGATQGSPGASGGPPGAGDQTIGGPPGATRSIPGMIASSGSGTPGGIPGGGSGGPGFSPFGNGNGSGGLPGGSGAGGQPSPNGSASNPSGVGDPRASPGGSLTGGYPSAQGGYTPGQGGSSPGGYAGAGPGYGGPPGQPGNGMSSAPSSVPGQGDGRYPYANGGAASPGSGNNANPPGSGDPRFAQAGGASSPGSPGNAGALGQPTNGSPFGAPGAGNGGGPPSRGGNGASGPGGGGSGDPGIPVDPRVPVMPTRVANQQQPEDRPPDEPIQPRPRGKKYVTTGGGGGEVGDASGDNYANRFAPATPAGARRKPIPVRPAWVHGGRDFYIYVECRPDSVVLYPSRQRFTLAELSRDPAHSPLPAAIQRMIDRRQAARRSDEPPYHPEVRFLVRPENLRTYYMVYPTLDALQIPKTSQNLDPDDDVDAITAGSNP